MRRILLLSLTLLPLLSTAQSPKLVVPVGHTDEVNAVAFLPAIGEPLVLTGSQDHTAILWDLSGREILAFKGHEGGVSALACFSSEEQQFILTGSEDNTAKLWGLSGQEIRTYKGHNGTINALAFSPDGNFILTGSADSTAILWDRQTGKTIQILNEHFSGVSAVAFSPDGYHLLAGSWRGREKAGGNAEKSDRGIVRLFSRQSGKEIWMNNTHRGPVNAVAFSADGLFVLTGSADHTVQLLSRESGKQIQSFTGKEARFTSVALSPSGKYVLAGDGSEAYLWDRTSGEVLRSFEGQEDRSNAIAFSPPGPGDPEGGKSLLTGGEQGAALWNWAGGLLQAYAGHSMAVTALALSGNTLLLGGWEGAVKRWNLSDMSIQSLNGLEEAVGAVGFSGVGMQAAALAASADNRAMQWDRNGKNIAYFEGGFSNISAIAFSPPAREDPAGGRYVLFGTEENTMELWDRKTGEKVNTIEKATREIDPRLMIRGESIESMNRRGLEIDLSPQRVSAVAFSPNDGGKNILSGDLDNTAELWDRQSGEKMVGFEGHSGSINAVAFSPDGQLILTGSEDSTAKLWQKNGQQVHTFSGHTDEVIAVAFSPDGRSVLTGSADNSMKLWNVKSGKLVHTLKGHTASVLAFSAACPEDINCPFGNGQFILSGSWDHTVKLWDARSGRELATLITIDSTNWVATTPSGLFDASPGAMQLMHYVLGLEVIGLEQLKERYYEPGLLQKLVGFSDEPIRSVDGFDAIALYPTLSLQLDTQAHQLLIELTPRSGGLGKVSVFINGKEIIEDHNPPQGFDRKRNTSLEPIGLTKYARYFLLDTLNTISVRAYNEAGWLKSPPQSVAYRPSFARTKGEPATDSPSILPFQIVRDPSLYAIIAGTSDYAGEKLDLKFPGKDATAMAQAILQAGGQLFDDRVHIRLFTTDTTDVKRHPTRDNIKAAFDEFKRKANAEDILLVYLSGHGVTYGDADQAQFYYLTQDISSENLSDEGIRNTRTISTAELTKWINIIPTQKQIMILDACNSGKVVEILDSGSKSLNSSQIRAFDRMKDRTGMYVLAGSAADKVSYEASQYGQGLLTYSVLEGMKGPAHRAGGKIDVVLLFEHARDRVPELARDIGGVQTPTLATPGGGGFDIGIVNERVHIPLEDKKPVFVRNVFLDKHTFYDALKIGKRLENQLREITAKGAQASLIYVDVPEYKNAYSINGFYQVRKGKVALEARLFKGQTSLGPIQANGRARQLDGLAEEILRQAFGILQQQ